MGNDWIREVLADLEMFARANELEDDLVNAVAKAALIAKEKFGATPGNFELTLPIEHNIDGTKSPRYSVPERGGRGNLDQRLRWIA